MALVRNPEGRSHPARRRDSARFSTSRGIEYERAKQCPSAPTRGGRHTRPHTRRDRRAEVTAAVPHADVIDVVPDSPILDAMLKRFNFRAWHAEDECGSRGPRNLPHYPLKGPCLTKSRAGDLIRGRTGTLHWSTLRRSAGFARFDLQDVSGWSALYVERRRRGFQPVLWPGRIWRHTRDAACEREPARARRTAVLLDIAGTTKPIRVRPRRPLPILRERG